MIIMDAFFLHEASLPFAVPHLSFVCLPTASSAPELNSRIKSQKVGIWCTGIHGVQLSGGVMVRTLNARLEGRGNGSRPFRFQAITLGKLSTRARASVTREYKSSKGSDALRLGR